MADTKVERIVIPAPKFGTIELILRGDAPLVIERFSKKAELMMKMAEGQKAKNRKTREGRDYENEAEEARYRAPDGWEGMNAASFRAGMIGVCRLTGFKMTIAKLSIFIEPDAFDSVDGLPLVRIYGKSVAFSAHTRNATGVVDVRVRPMYRDWAIRLRVRFDQDQFGTLDVINLVNRLGQQGGIGAGRPSSKSSAGCGWGLFSVATEADVEAIKEKFSIK